MTVPFHLPVSLSPPAGTQSAPYLCGGHGLRADVGMQPATMMMAAVKSYRSALIAVAVCLIAGCTSVADGRRQQSVDTEGWKNVDVPSDTLSFLLPPWIELDRMSPIDTVRLLQEGASTDHVYRFGFARARLLEPIAAGYVPPLLPFRVGSDKWTESVSGIAIEIESFEVQNRKVGFARFSHRGRDRSIWLAGDSDSTLIYFLSIVRSIAGTLRCDAAGERSDSAFRRGETPILVATSAAGC